MINVTVIYDTSQNTWNIMYDAECLFYGTAFEVDDWLDKNKLNYTEVE